MKSRGKNSEEIVQYLKENAANIHAISFDAPKEGSIKFSLNTKFETIFDADVDSQTSLLSVLTGNDFEIAKQYLSSLNNVPLLPEFKHLNIRFPEIIAQAQVSPVTKRRSSDMWLAPNSGNHSPVVSDVNETKHKNSM